MSAEGEVVHGLRAAAKLTGWSASGLQKMIDGGRVAAERSGRAYAFRVVDLEAIRRGRTPPEAGALVTTASNANTLPASHPDTLVPSPGRQEVASVAQPEPTNTSRAGDDGVVASGVFGDLAAGHSLTEIVIDRRLPPGLVLRAHEEWVALSGVDTLRKPEAEARLAQVEAAVQALADQLAAVEGVVGALSGQVAGAWRQVEGRLRVLDGRVNAASRGADTGEATRRLAALEQRVAALPAAPLPLDRRCPSCGRGALFVAVACSCCGAGRPPT